MMETYGVIVGRKNDLPMREIDVNSLQQIVSSAKLCVGNISLTKRETLLSQKTGDVERVLLANLQFNGSSYDPFQFKGAITDAGYLVIEFIVDDELLGRGSD